MWKTLIYSLTFGQLLPDLPLAGFEVEVLRLHGKVLAAVLQPAYDHLHGCPARGLETNARVAESWECLIRFAQF